MRHQDHISRLSRLFGIAPSALRYWDAEGLIRFERAPENQYRVPTAQTMMDISDVLLHRKCSLSIQEIRALPTLTPEEILHLLRTNEEKLTRQMASLQEARQSLLKRKGHIHTLESLRGNGLQVVRQKLPPIRRFSYEDPVMLERYQQDSSRGGIGIRAGLYQPEYTLWLDGTEHGDFRPADSENQTYLHGAFCVEAERDERTDLPRYRAEAAAQGYRAGALLGSYLLTAQEKGIRYDFYEAWLELF